MTGDEFEVLLDAQIALIQDTLVTKAKEYATSDRLHNFKVAAEMQGCSPAEALGGMMAKHTVSIYDMISSNRPYPMSVWEEKITDHMNYLVLLMAIVVEEFNQAVVDQ